MNQRTINANQHGVQAATDCYVRYRGVRIPARYYNGLVWVYDASAGHFTSRHTLSLQQEAYVRRMAAKRADKRAEVELL